MTDFRALCAEIIDAHDADEGMSVSRWTANLSAAIARTRAALDQPEPELPPNYIDAEHTGQDQELLKVFYKACLSEGGTADEITLRGLKAALAQPVTPKAKWRPTLTPEALELWDQAEAKIEASMQRIMAIAATRRPKTPSLKEQALLALSKLPPNRDCGAAHETIRRALEALPND